MKRHLAAFTAILFLLMATGLVGCSNNQKPTNPGAKGVQAGPKADPTRLAADLLRQGTELSHFRDGLQLLSPYMDSAEQRTKLLLKPEQREFLKNTVHLSDDELAEVEAGKFNPSDAYYLDESFLFRDIARFLEVPGLSPLEQAHRCFRWVVRNVALHEQGDQGLPPGYVVRRGFGGPLDRAFVFLELLRHYNQNGCVFVPAEPSAVPTLVGVHERIKGAISLFDLRLGVPIRSKKNTDAIATCADADAAPEILAASAITPEQWSKTEARLIAPLPALSPRMHELERLLAAQDKVSLFLDTQLLLKDIQAGCKQKVAFWNAPTAGSDSPGWALRQFLPVEEGGTDKSGRLGRFSAHLVPWAHVLLRLNQIKLFQELAPPARDVLVKNLVVDLFHKYQIQPREMMLRGQDVSRRLSRIAPLLDNAALASLGEDPEFQKNVAEWRQKMNDAYGAQMATKDPKFQAAINNLWSEDEYLSSLLRLESEDNPKNRQIKMQTLTRILAFACRDPLQQSSGWLTAAYVHEKAERAQALADLADKDNKTARLTARTAWGNARSLWNQYLDRVSLTPSGVKQRLEPVREWLRLGNVENALTNMEGLLLDLHHNFAAQFNLAQARIHAESYTAAESTLKSLREELDQISRTSDPKTNPYPDLQVEIAALLDAAKQKQNPVHILRAELLARDWAARGSLYWARQSVQQRLEALGKQ
jgi:hypothetical protein